jgi:predicted DNA-binding transcriptional regulator AlpA
MDSARRERLMTPTDVSDYYSIPVATLYQWRRRGYGPPAIRVGRHLRYDPAAVRAWFAGRGDDL